MRLVLHDRFTHHGTHSGYVQIARSLPQSWTAKIYNMNQRSRMGRWLARAKVLLIEGLPSRRISIHIYPEQTLSWSPFRLGRRVTVLHQPPAVYSAFRGFRLRSFGAALRGSDLVICLGPRQAEWAAERARDVVVIPHGIDTDYFRPGVKRRVALSVHGWLRDSQSQAVWEARLQGYGYDVRTIGPGHPRLNDDEYSNLLSSATVLVVSAPDGVASNALLEGMACGAAIVGELSEDCLWYLSAENQELLDAGSYRQDELERAGRANREKAVTYFEWSVVRGKVLERSVSHR